MTAQELIENLRRHAAWVGSARGPCAPDTAAVMREAADALEAAEKRLEAGREAWVIQRPNGEIANGTNSTFSGGSWKQYIEFHGGHQEYYEQQGHTAVRVLIVPFEAGCKGEK